MEDIKKGESKQMGTVQQCKGVENNSLNVSVLSMIRLVIKLSLHIFIKIRFICDFRVGIELIKLSSKFCDLNKIYIKRNHKK